MTNFRNLVAISATAAIVAVGHNVIAQDDLDDLLNSLEAESKPAEKAEAKHAEAATVEEKAAETEKVETEKAEAAEEQVAESESKTEKAEEPVQEEPTVAKETAEEKPAEETPVAKKDDNADPALLKHLDSDKEAEEAEPEAAEEQVAEKEVEKSAKQEVAAAEKPEAEKTEQVAEKKAEEGAEQPPYTGKDPELIAAMEETAKIQIRAVELQADREMAEAHKCMASEEYMEMAKHFQNASKLLNDSPANASKRKECEQGIAEGLYRAAIQEYTTGRRERAMKLMDKAIQRRHPRARRQQETWLRAGDPDANKTDVSEIEGVRNKPEYMEMRAKNAEHLKRSRQYFGVGQLKRALDECELVLLTDPDNASALRLRDQIEKKRQTILQVERKAARDGMIAAVDEAWRPVYAVDAREVETTIKGTGKKPLMPGDPERAQEQKIIDRMKEMRLPAITFKPPATIIDAVEFFRTASKDYDRPDLPLEQRGFNFVLNLPKTLQNAAAPAAVEDAGGFGDEAEEAPASGGPAGVPVIPMITASDISFYDALKLVCESVEFKFTVKGPIVMVMHKNASVEEMVTRSYPVLSSFMERMNVASEDMKSMQSSSGNFGAAAGGDGGEENQERDWKAFFELLGVKWPEGSSIMYIKTIGKLRVRNTYENLAELEQALTEMNADPKLIEIETRFVEVCQEDLNSLGFEWILNSDYTLNFGKHLGRALGVRPGVFGERVPATAATPPQEVSIGGVNTTIAGTPGTPAHINKIDNPNGAKWIRNSYGVTQGGHHNVGVNAFGGTSDYQNGQRYLSTLSNHISGEGYQQNDQFMRINAFIGSADLSMILHMLSQRSDTDLLSAPKVLTQSGQEAVMKVVTEYIYPTDYDVQLQSSSSSSSGSNSGGSQSAILAVVEPQSFTMREVGVILDVTPTLTDDGNLIDLDLNTQVVDEPTWKNYGMRIPFTGNSSLQSFEGIGGILDGLSSILTTLGTAIANDVKQAFAESAVDSATAALENLTKTSSDNMTYYDAPMEQPFFHVRSVVSKLSVYPGATIVMGGLITEQRKAMDDKIPFLGDIPFIGRFFRSHAEQTSKRNLLIFVTTRLVDTQGRELHARNEDVRENNEVVAAPAAD